jgi:hypothetical protein
VKKPKLPKFNFFKKSTESKSTQAGTHVGTHVDASTQAGRMKLPKQKPILPSPDHVPPKSSSEREKIEQDLKKHYEYMDRWNLRPKSVSR